MPRGLRRHHQGRNIGIIGLLEGERKKKGHKVYLKEQGLKTPEFGERKGHPYIYSPKDPIG